MTTQKSEREEALEAAQRAIDTWGEGNPPIVQLARALLSSSKAEGEMRGIAKNAGLLLAAIYEWLERVEKAGGATGISGVAACHAMLTSLRKNAPRAEKLVLAPLRAALSKSEGK